MRDVKELTRPSAEFPKSLVQAVQVPLEIAQPFGPLPQHHPFLEQTLSLPLRRDRHRCRCSSCVLLWIVIW